MRIEVNDIHYHVKVIGEGEPLLLLHGFTGAGEDWTPFIEDWKNDHQLIMVDLPGHGQTECPDHLKNYSMEATVDALDQILNELKIESAFVLGYSLGGRVALSFAMTYPARVKKLILESSSPGLATEEDRLDRQQRDNRLADRIMDEGIEAFVDFWEAIPLFRTQLTYLSSEERARLHASRLNNSEVGLANSLRGIGTGVQPSWWDHLHQFEVPTTLIVGQLDAKFVKIAKEMLRLLPDGELVAIEDAGHTVHLEQPEAFSQTVHNILHNRKDD
ncbi:2-succinyl-6-hydroxy-2,4-cyclohexadiene-1-carboxylate synthase [Pseudalkalibacillus sp. Hm43]|uniref:2-succinyl-6-hydroxy-2, 4-cyclohexadiene-1-carboxylate synthase n=1 Tax=Pseudalkalibacillus sp. Hm43 TaxID=3450742 RepID=UPI003F421B10